MAQEYKLRDLTSLSLAPGAKQEVEVEGIDRGKVLLVNAGGKVQALGSNCTHYGAPLVKGVLTTSGRLTCPWHGGRYLLPLILLNLHMTDMPQLVSTPRPVTLKTPLLLMLSLSSKFSSEMVLSISPVKSQPSRARVESPTSSVPPLMVPRRKRLLLLGVAQDHLVSSNVCVRRATLVL